MLAGISRKLDAHIEDPAKHREKIEKAILGDGSQRDPALVTRIDRLETESSNRRWHVRALWTAILAALASVFQSLTGPVRGRRTTNVVPTCGVEVTLIFPEWASTICRATNSPTPK